MGLLIFKYFIVLVLVFGLGELLGHILKLDKYVRFGPEKLCEKKV